MERGERCVLLATNSIRWVATDLAIMSEGILKVPMYTRQAPEELAKMMRDCDATLILCGTDELRDEGRKDRDFKTLGANPLPCYFNSGCGLYPSGPTAVEIADGEIRLVRWQRASTGKGREELQKGDLAGYLERIAAG